MIKGIDERLLSVNKVQNEYNITKNMKFPDILQAMLTLNSSWDRITQQTIRNCWIHANLIPSSMVAALRNMAEIENEVGDDIEKICDLLSNYQLDDFEGKMTKTNKQNMLKNDIEEWIIIESNESVMMNVLDEQLWEENYVEEKEDENENESKTEIEESSLNTQFDFLQVFNLYNKLYSLAQPTQDEWEKLLPDEVSFSNFLRCVESMKDISKKKIKEISALKK